MLRNQPGIHSVKVALLAERAVVEYDPEKWTVEKIAEVSATIHHACQARVLTSARINRKYPTLASMRRSFRRLDPTLLHCAYTA